MALIELAKVIADDPAVSRRWAAEPLPLTDRLTARRDAGWALTWSGRRTAALSALISVAEDASRDQPALAWDASRTQPLSPTSPERPPAARP
jgi:hypothetical protein